MATRSKRWGCSQRFKLSALRSGNSRYGSAGSAARIAALEARLQELADGNAVLGGMPGFAPDDYEAYLRSVVSFEESALRATPVFDQLLRRGVTLPEPGSLDEASVHAVLWRLIRVLAEMHIYLLFTDHLSDQQLYSKLWCEWLRRPEPELGPDSLHRLHFDLLSPPSDENLDIFLRYYLDDQGRREGPLEGPYGPIPPHEDPPYDRDRHLPLAPPGIMTVAR